MIEGLGTYGVMKPARTIPASKKYLVVHLIDQLVLHKQHLRAMQDFYFDSAEEYNYALCCGIAKALARNYHINAFAAGGSGHPRAEFDNELQPVYEAICSEQQLQKSIMEAAGTLDIEVQLTIRGFHLYAEIVTFPFRETFDNKVMHNRVFGAHSRPVPALFSAETQTGYGVPAFAQNVLDDSSSSISKPSATQP